MILRLPFTYQPLPQVPYTILGYLRRRRGNRRIVEENEPEDPAAKVEPQKNLKLLKLLQMNLKPPLPFNPSLLVPAPDEVGKSVFPHSPPKTSLLNRSMMTAADKI